MKKILIVGAEVQPIPPVKGGAVEHLVDFILHDNETDRYADFTVISPYTEDALKASGAYRHTEFFFVRGQDSLEGKIIDFSDLFARKFFDHSSGKYYLKQVCRFLEKHHEYDLVIVENRPLFGQHIRKHYKGPLYLHLHNDFIHKDSRHLQDILGNYDRYIVISDFLKRRISEVEKADIEVLYNGVDLNDDFSMEETSDIRNIIYAGRLVREKGVLELVRAYKRLARQNTRLTVIGDYDEVSEDHRQFRREFATECDREDIVLVGQVPNSEMGTYYKGAYVGVVPSIVNEALSLTAIEMLGSGLPVIATDAGGLPEVVDDSCGITVSRDRLEDDLKEAMEKILDDKAYRDRLAEGARRKALNFTKERYLKQFKKMIEEL